MAVHCHATIQEPAARRTCNVPGQAGDRVLGTHRDAAGGWHHVDLTANAPGAAANAAGPLTCFFDEPHTVQHVFYRGADSRVHELWWIPQL